MSQRVTSMGLGVITALLLAEGGLRVIATPNPPDAGPLAVDRPDVPVETVRWYSEGIAESHFSSAKARVIPADPDGAVAVLLLGDSFVQALQVGDTETMGAQLAALLGRRVLQYGWSGAGPARYLLVADTLLGRWTPERVVVVLTAGDLGREAIRGAQRLVLDPMGGVPRIEGAIRDSRGGRLHRVLEQVIEHSVLAGELVRRVALVRRGGPGGEAAAPGADAAVVRGVVQALQAGIGPRLLIAYVPVVVGDAPAADPVERELLQSCADLGAVCVSARAAFVTELAATHRYARGFPNGPPGTGHLNALGHRLVAGVIRDGLAADRRR